MRKVAAAASLLSLALVSGASAQVLVPTDPFTGAVVGTNVAVVQGASVAGPVGAVVAAPVGFVAGAIAGTAGAIGTVANALVGGPAYGYGYGYAPQPVYYTTASAYPVATGSTVVYRRPATRTVYVAPRRSVAVAYAQPRRVVRSRVVYRDRGYQRAAIRSGRVASFREVSYRGRAEGRMGTMTRVRSY